MKKKLQEFINNVPLEIHQSGNKIMCVGIRWGFCKNTVKEYGQKNVSHMLNLLENEYSYLLSP